MAEAVSPSTTETGLKQEINWWDGVVITSCVPGFLVVSIGFSVSLLGGWGAVAVWTGVASFGFLMAVLYAELAAAFPHRSGGIATYIDESVHTVSRIPAVVSAYGYWFGYSTVLSINGILVGSYIQAAWLPNVHVYLTKSTDIFAPIIGTVMLVVVWAVAIAGIRPTVYVTYALGFLTLAPLLLIALAPWVTGHMNLANLNNSTFPANGAVPLSLAGLGIFFAMWYLGGWSLYAVECAAAFTPEYKNPAKDTPKALMIAGALLIFITLLVIIGLVGTVGQKVIIGQPYVAFVPAAQILFGGAGSVVVVVMLLSALVLSALISTADGGRALYQLARDGLTIKWLAHLNNQKVPDNGMTWDLGIQFVLMWLPYLAGVIGFSWLSANAPIVILAVSNVGYILCHIMAVGSFLILRQRRPDLARPFRVGAYMLPIAWFLLFFNVMLIFVGAFNPSLGYGPVPFFLGVLVLCISVVLYYVRRRQDAGMPSTSAPAAGS